MLYKGKLFRAELFDKHTAPYTNVRSVYEANKNRYKEKKLIVTNAHWYASGAKPCGNYKVKGTVLSQEDASWPGFGWNSGEMPEMVYKMSCENFVGTIPAILSGKENPLSGWGGVARCTERTWWGFTKSGECMIEVTTSGYTLDQIQDRMAQMLVFNGIVLDGSGSSQWYDGETYIRGDGRVVYSYLLLWFDETEKEQDAPDKENCPYAEPTYNVRYGSRGNGAKWVQWYLNRCGASLDVDGVIGSQSLAAIRVFQRAHSLDVDGIAGKDTRVALKAAYGVSGPVSNDALNIIEESYKWNGALQTRSSTTLLILHHEAASGSTAQQIHNYHLSLGWCGIAYHYYIRKDGTIYRGRPEIVSGGHTAGKNYCSIGICFEGNFETDIMSEAQKNAGRLLVADIVKRYPGIKVGKHSDYCATACPGKNFPFNEIAG